ncbi:MAG: 30S ribosomal protein S27ae [Nanoarchaeota archaeon]|nr:30S ribosomal protein S27ae [Nanoarchaeota archaeon]
MAKKKAKNKKSSERWKHYKVNGNALQKTKRECPKCGAGVFLADHKDRHYCGRCMYVEMKGK